MSLTNLGTRTREIELTSYAEIVLAPPAADAAHPAFSNLFVQTEFAPELGALLATRRPRSHGEPQVWAAHVVVVEGETVGERAIRDRPRPVSRPRARDPNADVGHRRPPALQHGRRGARSDLQPPAPRAAGAGRHRPRHLLDARRAIARRGARPGRQVPRSGDVRARGHAGVDAGPGPAPPSRHRPRRGPPLPGPRQPDPVLGPDAAAVVRGARTQYPGALGALGARNLRRPADRPGAHRRARGSGHRPAAPPRPRILADEAAGGRSRDPERTGPVLRSRSPGRSGGTGPHEPVTLAARGA